MAAACTPFVSGPNSDTVKLAVPWGGAELRAFEDVLADLRDSRQFSHSTQVFTLGDDVGTVFSAGRYTPDIVVLPQLGQITRLAQDGRLRPLDESLWGDERKAPRYAHGWWELVHVETVSGNRWSTSRCTGPSGRKSLAYQLSRSIRPCATHCAPP
ncbi:hypothetical protein [Nocardia sp. NPDC004711]